MRKLQFNSTDMGGRNVYMQFRDATNDPPYTGLPFFD